MFPRTVTITTCVSSTTVVPMVIASTFRWIVTMSFSPGVLGLQVVSNLAASALCTSAARGVPSLIS